MTSSDRSDTGWWTLSLATASKAAGVLCLQVELAQLLCLTATMSCCRSTVDWPSGVLNAQIGIAARLFSSRQRVRSLIRALPQGAVTARCSRVALRVHRAAEEHELRADVDESTQDQDETRASRRPHGKARLALIQPSSSLMTQPPFAHLPKLMTKSGWNLHRILTESP